MTMFNPSQGILACTGVITGGTGAGTVKGGVVGRTGAGVYTLTLDQPVNSADGGVLVTCVSAVAAFGTIAHTSDTVKAVTTFNQAGAATDTSWNAVAYRATP